MPTTQNPSSQTGIFTVDVDLTLARARDVLEQEAAAIASAAQRLGPGFTQAVALIAALPGRVVVTGMGKSAIIAQKLVATFNSTGTPALYMHAADALHGDLGMVQRGDLVILISKSGDTAELKQLVPLLQPTGVPLVALVGRVDSYLGRHAAATIDASVQSEACPNNLAPTTSTTVALALGDALAVCLMHQRGFTDADFARYHPGGTLGKRLYLRVADLMHREAPQVSPSTPLRELIVAMTRGRLGAALVVTQGSETGPLLQGIVTDGDLRRLLERTAGTDWAQLDATTAGQLASHQPKYIGPDALAVAALEQMDAHNITQLVVAESAPEGLRPLGLLHLHDLLAEGL